MSGPTTARLELTTKSEKYHRRMYRRTSGQFLCSGEPFFLENRQRDAHDGRRAAAKCRFVTMDEFFLQS